MPDSPLAVGPKGTGKTTAGKGRTRKEKTCVSTLRSGMYPAKLVVIIPTGVR